MTTVATNGKSVVCDGIISSVGRLRLSTSTIKIAQVGENIIGFAGIIDQFPLFVDFIRYGEAPEGMDLDGCSAFVLYPENRIMAYDDGPYPTSVELPYAIGSGRELALGAMAAGATPLRAVLIACEYDNFSGGEVYQLQMKKKRKRGK